MNICKDCIYCDQECYNQEESNYWKCIRPRPLYVNLVSGSNFPAEGQGFQYCADERKDEAFCGHGGKYFKPCLELTQ